MEKIKHYSVISETKLTQLENRVREAIDAGWTPFGNLVIVQDPNDNQPHFIQTIVVYK